MYSDVGPRGSHSVCGRFILSEKKEKPNASDPRDYLILEHSPLKDSSQNAESSVEPLERQLKPFPRRSVNVVDIS